MDFHNISFICCFLTDNWGAIADFLSLFAVIILAVIVYHADQKRHSESQNLARDLNKPILVFKIFQTDIDGQPKDFYKIVNLGKGPALNIVLAYKDGDTSKNTIDKEWDKDDNGKDKDIVNCYSLGELEEPLVLCWHSGGHRWIARYEDIFGKKYYTICQDDTLTIIDIDKSKSKPEIKECVDLENYINKNISNTDMIKRLWSVQKKNKDCKEIADKNRLITKK